MALSGTDKEVKQEAAKIEGLYKDSQEAGDGQRDGAIAAFQNEIQTIAQNNPAFFRRVCNQIRKDDETDGDYDVSVEYDAAGNPTHLQFNPGIWDKVWGQRSGEKTLEDRYTKSLVDTLGNGGDSVMSNFKTLMEKNNQNLDVVAEKLTKSLAGTGIGVRIGLDAYGQRAVILSNGNDSVSMDEFGIFDHEGSGVAGLRETLNRARQQRQQDSIERDPEMTMREIDDWFKKDRARRRRGH